MYNALLTVTIAGALYARDIVLAFVPHADPFIELHAEGKPMLCLRVQSVRNRISHKQQGFVPIWIPPALPLTGFDKMPMLSIRAFIQGDTPGLMIPQTDRASDAELVQLDKDLAPWGLQRVMPRTPETDQLMKLKPVKEEPHNLRVIFNRAMAVQWYSMKGQKATVANVIAGSVIGDLHVIGESETDDGYWRIQGKYNPAAGEGGCYANVPKDAVEIPSSRSVKITFQDNLEFDWVGTDGRRFPAHIGKGNTLDFKAVLANPLNTEQIAFILQDNRYAHLPSSCFKFRMLPAGDLTDLPKFQKGSNNLGDALKVVQSVQHKVQLVDVPAVPTEPLVGLVPLAINCVGTRQLPDDGASRKFSAGESVLIVSISAVPENSAQRRIRLVDGHSWDVPAAAVNTQGRSQLWLQFTKDVFDLPIQFGLDTKLFDVPAGTRICLKQAMQTQQEQYGRGDTSRKFMVAGSGVFSLEQDQYRLGQVPVGANCIWVNTVSPREYGIANVWLELTPPWTLGTPQANVFSTTTSRKDVKLPTTSAKVFAMLFERPDAKPTTAVDYCTITLPSGDYFSVPAERVRIIGGFRPKSEDMPSCDLF